MGAVGREGGGGGRGPATRTDTDRHGRLGRGQRAEVRGQERHRRGGRGAVWGRWGEKGAGVVQGTATRTDTDGHGPQAGAKVFFVCGVCVEGFGFFLTSEF